MRDAIGAVLRRRRQELGWTLREVSERSNVSTPHLSDVERGNKEVSSELLATICGVLDLTMSRLLTEASVELGTIAAPSVARRGQLALAA